MEKQFLEVAGMLAEIESIKIYVEAMKAANYEREIAGESAAYGEESFITQAESVLEISAALKMMASE